MSDFVCVLWMFGSIILTLKVATWISRALDGEVKHE